ncbi:MAG: ribosome-associated translation inhibitor RaiA [Acidimicrobiales bacterium]
MDITVSARHMDISPALRAAAEDKIGRLSRFQDDLHRGEVHFSEERNPRISDKEVCEVSLEGGGHHLRCKVAAADPFAAIDLAVAKLEQQLHKLKTKTVLRTHQGPRHSDQVLADAESIGTDLLA